MLLSPIYAQQSVHKPIEKINQSPEISIQSQQRLADIRLQLGMLYDQIFTLQSQLSASAGDKAYKN